MKLKQRLAIPALVLLGAGVVFAARWIPGENADSSSHTVAREDFRVLVEATGKLEAEIAFEIGPPSVKDYWQYNLSWMIPEGSRVKKDEVIARFDTTQLDDRLREHRADLETTVQEREKEERNLEVNIRQLELDLVKAEGEMKKLDVHLAVPEEIASSIEIEQLKLERSLARRRYDFLAEKIEFEKTLVETKLELLDVKRSFSQGKIDYYEEAKRKFEVKAPVAGMVVYIPKRNGDRWEVGEGIWMLAKIMKIADISTLRVEANVLEVDSAKIAAGHPAEVSVDAIPGLSFSTEIREIGRIVHERSVQDPSKVFDAYLPLNLENTEGLRPGMGVKVQIETDVLEGALTVPLESVRAGSEGTWVEVVGAGGATEKRRVILGARNRQRVVVQSGLEEGEVVSLDGGMS